MDIDDVINQTGVLAHADYDPAARRQRYLKSRKLKGRRPGQQVIPPPKVGVGSRVVESGNAASALHFPTHATTAARQAASSARQVAAIQGRLNSLKAHLKELLAKQKASSSSSSSDSKEKSSDSSASTDKAGPSKPKTAKQKQAAKESLKKAQDARAKEQKAAPDKKEPKTSLSLDDQISKTREVISDVEAKLKSVKEHART